MRGKPLFSRATLGLLRPKCKILGVDVAGTVQALGGGVTRSSQMTRSTPIFWTTDTTASSSRSRGRSRIPTVRPAAWSWKVRWVAAVSRSSACVDTSYVGGGMGLSRMPTKAVASPQLLTEDLDRARRLLDLASSVPNLVWGRDETQTGGRWNSNSVISWLIASSGLPTDVIRPPGRWTCAGLGGWPHHGRPPAAK
jgi:hypothetical protein